MNTLSLLIILEALIVSWIGVLTFWFWRINKFSRQFTEGISKKNLHSLLEKILKDLDDKEEKLSGLTEEIEKLRGENIYDIKKIGLVRFNPFVDTGGDQSFCLALLDGEDNGIVVSSLHSRETTRVYAKTVKNGKGVDYQLSTEEIQAIKKAKRIHGK